ncbi:phage head completion protein [Enterococcus nangangensis]|uniref:phage head completion protein n=1 Tax=Enterococcus nangangensis TaxID=2559926 RepID=UPI0010F7EC9B|nr:head-tail adaptor protein [Enterococcus nangangensis]
MYPPRVFSLQKRVQLDDGIGGFEEKWKAVKKVSGYIDLLTGDDRTSPQQAFIEESTHVLVIPDYHVGITDEMRVVDDESRWYEITYSDNPVGIAHHNELYLKYGGVLQDGQ